MQQRRNCVQRHFAPTSIHPIGSLAVTCRSDLYLLA
jgi:hypothetical protein